MPPIQVLSDSLINKIAAGEVVERPASVVKELLENALDAGATNIDISLEEGGKKSILVRDNGCGIPPDELHLAVSRHATSKIQSIDDLFAVKTLGFRGEALASIASVSKMTITSRYTANPPSPPFTKGGKEFSPLCKRGDGGDLNPAHEIRLEGGKVVFDGPSAHPPGTTLLVKYLFYQTPARLKFLKSPETEMTHILDCVTRIALANPGTSIHLGHNGKKITATNGEGGLKEALRSLFDDETARQTYDLSGGNEEISVTGLVGHPMISRSHNRNLYLFVNGRPVHDRIIMHAVMEAYRNTLMRGRYPFAVVFLNLPGGMVDVNVHPAKAEVRFADSRIVHNYVQESVRKTLEGEPWRIGSVFAGTGDTFGVAPDRAAGATGLNGSCRSSPPSPASSSFAHGDDRRISELGLLADSGGPPVASPLHPRCAEDERETRRWQDPFQQSRQLAPLGQILGTYLVCEAEGKLVLIDQHAAHERILFDRLLEQYKEGSIACQQLLIPENFDLPPSDAEILKKHLKEMGQFGLEIGFFGGCTFIVRALPVLLQGRVSIKNLALDITGDQVEKGKLTSLTDNLNGLLASMACHSAVRANRRLTVSEIKSLLDDLDRYPLTSFCPHGRPVAVEISQRELEKWFKRIV